MNQFSFQECCYYDESKNKFDGRFLLKKKVFDKDFFTVDEDNEITIKESFYRDKERMTGVLLLNNTSYGCHKNKFLYKCIPTDKNLPNFVIPYQKKYSFEKNPEKIYILFKFDCWNSINPQGILLETFGNVDNFSAYCKYLLYSKDLFFSLKHQIKLINNIHSIDIYNIEDRSESHKVFTIDPENCKDFDDAFSVKNQIITTYIANSPIILDKLNLWEGIHQISSIYLPQQTRNMLCSQLSENWCSLVSDSQRKLTFYMDYDTTTENIRFGVCYVKIWKNFIYEEKDLLKDDDYKFLSETSKEVDSHNVVAYFMMFMNEQCAKVLKKGIFRSTEILDRKWECSLLNEIFSYCGIYKLEKMEHEALGMKEYGHFTSPIRRLVDTINLIQLQEQLNLWSFTKDTKKFCKEWMKQIDVINEQTKKIKKVQTNCFLLDSLENEQVIKCLIVEKPRDDNYTVYSIDFRFFGNLKSSKILKIGDEIFCKIIKLKNENDIKKKIRLSIIN